MLEKLARKLNHSWQTCTHPNAVLPLEDSRETESRSRELQQVEMVRRSLFSKKTIFAEGPFGPRRNTYVDNTASGQPLRLIEEYIQARVLPFYANTHTTSTNTALQMTNMRGEAREIIRVAVGASRTEDAVIFCGSGSTGPIHKLVHHVKQEAARVGCGEGHGAPIVFVGPFEHHSNLLPWREIGAKVINVPETKAGEFDIQFLELKLEEIRQAERNRGAGGLSSPVGHRLEQLVIGSFSAASNLNGVATDDVAVTVLMHKYGARVFWDYSAAGPHVRIQMNPSFKGVCEGLTYKDAIFFSGHKFVGGPQTPGVLVVKRGLIEHHVPHCVGGGTVLFVDSFKHNYLTEAEHREEGGTPAIVESVRLGLVFQLKRSIGSAIILQREEEYLQQIISEFATSTNIQILGPTSVPRVAIVAFTIDNPQSGYYLHHNFVVALLNDLFGIQTRGGCVCAGPYAQSVLGIDDEQVPLYEKLLLEGSSMQGRNFGHELFKPGFVRLSVPYYFTQQDTGFVIEAVKLVASEGWKLLPLYDPNLETGEFQHYKRKTLASQHEHHIDLLPTKVQLLRVELGNLQTQDGKKCPEYKECLEHAKRIFADAKNLCHARMLTAPYPHSEEYTSLAASEWSYLRWFLLPAEALHTLDTSRDGSGPSLHNSDDINDNKYCSNRRKRPFTVKRYPAVTASADTYYDGSVASQCCVDQGKAVICNGHNFSHGS